MTAFADFLVVGLFCFMFAILFSTIGKSGRAVLVGIGVGFLVAFFAYLSSPVLLVLGVLTLLGALKFGA
jgi:hypothetical protein